MKTFEKVINNICFKTKAEEELSAQVETLFSIISDLPPEKIEDSFRLEVFGNIYILKKCDNYFIIQTYDYSSNSLENFIDDLTLPLWMQLEQGHLLRKLNLEGKKIRFDDKIIFAEGVFDSDDVFLQRNNEAIKGDSGWFIGYKNQKNSKLKACYAYQLLKLKKEYIQFLSIPNDYLIVIENSELKAILNGENINVF